MNLFVTIDGPTASGKTTLGISLAEKLNAAFYDTGLTFRALSYALYQQSLEPQDDWRSIIQHHPLLWESTADSEKLVARQEFVVFQGRNITEGIFAPDLEPYLTLVASNPLWRKEIGQFHSEAISNLRRLVIVGRDVGVALLPEATLHVALRANRAVRRERRRAQYRDLHDRSTNVGPATRQDFLTLEKLCGKANTIAIDTTFLPAAAVARAVLRRLEGADDAQL